MAWTEDRVALLKKLWKDGNSGSQIARLMGGVTRNAVIGKAHRMGLSNRGDTPIGQGKRVEYKKATAPKAKRKPVVPRMKEADIKPLASDDLSVMNVRNNQCHWPVDRPNTEGLQFCGQPIDGPNADGAKTSYCAEHRAVGTQRSYKTTESAKWKRT